MEYRYFKVDGSMEKKWDIVIPEDWKRLFVSRTYTFRWSRKGYRKIICWDMYLNKTE